MSSRSVTDCLQGLAFMHEHHVAHRCVHFYPNRPHTEFTRDCMVLNIMYDPRPMYPDMYHPLKVDVQRNFKGKAKFYTRTVAPVKYYYIDFGLSMRYNLDDGPPREHPIAGGDKSVPEFKDWNGELLDPFPTDIYYLGNMLHNFVLKVRISRLCPSCASHPDFFCSR